MDGGHFAGGGGVGASAGGASEDGAGVSFGDPGAGAAAGTGRGFGRDLCGGGGARIPGRVHWIRRGEDGGTHPVGGDAAPAVRWKADRNGRIAGDDRRDLGAGRARLRGKKYLEEKSRKSLKKGVDN